jgi:serine/threonine-protein kinase
VLFGLRRDIRDARRLGQYTLVERLGGGGMGEVYRAKHAFLRRPTAVKLLPHARPGDRSLLRFEREVQLTASLVHPNTIRIFDYGRTADGVFYYAMELLDGGDLEMIVDVDGPQSASRTVHIGAQVAASLAEAHAVGLVHRDIKPENVILCSKGVPDLAKVLDFGLVLDVEQGLVDEKNLIVGTPAFISPEAVAQPADIGPASDIYSLGCVLYFLLTGEFVFDAETVARLCAMHVTEPPIPPSERVDAPVPKDLEALVLACLAKDPAARPKSAVALRDALRGCNVPRWTEEDAERWWGRFGASVGNVAGERAAQISESRLLSVVRSAR